jgi:predicted nucleic acid-binding Zn ribbon protein
MAGGRGAEFCSHITGQLIVGIGVKPAADVQPLRRGVSHASFRSLLTPLAAYGLVFGSWRLQDGPQETTALRF